MISERSLRRWQADCAREPVRRRDSELEVVCTAPQSVVLAYRAKYGNEAQDAIVRDFPFSAARTQGKIRVQFGAGHVASGPAPRNRFGKVKERIVYA